MILKQWERKTPLTPEQADAELKAFRARYGACTCDGCPDRMICSCSFDPYNIGGDCLYEK